MFGRDGTTGKACEGDTEYGGIRENGKEAATSGKVGRGCSVPFRSDKDWNEVKELYKLLLEGKFDTIRERIK